MRTPVLGGELVGHRGGEGPPALLLHGGPALPDYMDGCAQELHGLFHAIRYTQRGVAPSVAQGPFSIETHVADALTVLDSEGVERAWAIGHSWGGHLALHIAVSHPERLLGVICIDTLGAYGEIFEEYGANLRRGLRPEQTTRVDEIEALRRRGEAAEEDLLERMAMLWPLLFAEASAATPLPATRIGVECSRETNASLVLHFEQGTLAKALPHARLPALFVHGEADPLPARSSIETSALIPGASVTLIPGCGHFPWLERPGALLEAVALFLGEGAG